MKCVFSKLWRHLRKCLPGHSGSTDLPYTPSAPVSNEKPSIIHNFDRRSLYESRTPSPSSMDLPASVHSVETDEEWKELEEMRNRMMHPPGNHSIDNYSVDSNDSGFDSSTP